MKNDTHYPITAKGFSLIELMIALAVGMILIAGVTSVYLSTLKSTSHTLRYSKLNQELSTLMGVMTSDIHRAGIWGAMTAADYNLPHMNPFSQVNVTVLEVIDDIATNNIVAPNNAAGGHCIVYTYDANLNGTLDNNDIVGFRLNAGVVEMRQMGNVVANTRHDSCADSDDTWIPVTDGRLIKVTDLNFSRVDSACLNTREPNAFDDDADAATTDDDERNCYTIPPTAGSGNITVETRQINIILAGELVSDSSVKANLTQSARVRNDLVRIR